MVPESSTDDPAGMLHVIPKNQLIFLDEVAFGSPGSFGGRWHQKSGFQLHWSLIPPSSRPGFASQGHRFAGRQHVAADGTCGPARRRKQSFWMSSVCRLKIRIERRRPLQRS